MEKPKFIDYSLLQKPKIIIIQKQKKPPSDRRSLCHNFII